MLCLSRLPPLCRAAECHGRPQEMYQGDCRFTPAGRRRDGREAGDTAESSSGRKRRCFECVGYATMGKFMPERRPPAVGTAGGTGSAAMARIRQAVLFRRLVAGALVAWHSRSPPLLAHTRPVGAALQEELLAHGVLPNPPARADQTAAGRQQCMSESVLCTNAPLIVANYFVFPT